MTPLFATGMVEGQARFFDNIVVSKARIGCTAGAPLPEEVYLPVIRSVPQKVTAIASSARPPRENRNTEIVSYLPLGSTKGVEAVAV